MKKKTHNQKNKKSKSEIGVLCWVVVPIALVALLILDGIGLYKFNTERLLVIGACVMVTMFPFFEEITIKNISVKRDSNCTE